MLKCESNVEMWMKCWNVNQILKYESNVVMWIKCCNVNQMLKCETNAEMWIKCCNMNQILKRESNVEMSIKCWNVNQMLKCESNVVIWIKYWNVNQMLKCESNVEMWKPEKSLSIIKNNRIKLNYYLESGDCNWVRSVKLQANTCLLCILLNAEIKNASMNMVSYIISNIHNNGYDWWLGWILSKWWYWESEDIS